MNRTELANIAAAYIAAVNAADASRVSALTAQLVPGLDAVDANTPETAVVSGSYGFWVAPGTSQIAVEPFVPIVAADSPVAQSLTLEITKVTGTGAYGFLYSLAGGYSLSSPTTTPVPGFVEGATLTIAVTKTPVA